MVREEQLAFWYLKSHLLRTTIPLVFTARLLRPHSLTSTSLSHINLTLHRDYIPLPHLAQQQPQLWQIAYLSSIYIDITIITHICASLLLCCWLSTTLPRHQKLGPLLACHPAFTATHLFLLNFACTPAIVAFPYEEDSRKKTG